MWRVNSVLRNCASPLKSRLNRLSLSSSKPTQATPSSRQSFWQRFLLALWYPESQNRSIIAYCFYPFAALLQRLAELRANYLKKQQPALSKPLVVVGNINVGGVGKTPLVIAMVNALSEQGIKVGIISRGYGSAAPRYPFLVTQTSSVNDSGDEALLLAQSSDSPVVIDADRNRALNFLLAQFPDIDLIISDDGLQHYRLARSMEIVVIDGERGLGNGLCLPAGPLRESTARLHSVDWLIANGEIASESLLGLLRSFNKPLAEVELNAKGWLHIKSQKRFPLRPFPWESLAVSEQAQETHAIAAIGYPQRFFSTLKSLGIESVNTAFDDHHEFNEDDLIQWHNRLLLMTSKDAVKCHSFAQDNWWALDVVFQLPSALLDDIRKLISQH